MSSLPEPTQPFLDALAKLRAGWPGVGWSWDGRFRCVSSSFDKKIAERVREVTAEALGPGMGAWTAANLASTPPAVQALAERYGGLRAGQMLFTGAAVGGMRLFALWWPWGDASTISLRVSIENGERDAELFPKVRALFGLA